MNKFWTWYYVIKLAANGLYFNPLQEMYRVNVSHLLDIYCYAIKLRIILFKRLRTILTNTI